MRLRETLLGLVVLGLVLGGVLWVRGRSDSGAAVPDAAAETAMPDVTVADGTVTLGDVRITLSVTPRPPEAFAKHRYRVRVESGAVPLALEGGRICFEMAMPMGDHGYALVPAGGGWQEAVVVLPVCQSGNRRWYATVEGTTAGQRLAARFRVDLTPPGSASP